MGSAADLPMWWFAWLICMMVIWSVGAVINAGRKDQAEPVRRQEEPGTSFSGATGTVRVPDRSRPGRPPDPPERDRPRFPTRVQRLQARFEGRQMVVDWEQPEHLPKLVAGYEVQVAPIGEAVVVGVRTKGTSARLDVPDLRRTVYEVSVFTLSRELTDTSGVCFGRVSKRRVVYRGAV